MIHVDSITGALFTQLSSDATLVASGFTVQEGEGLNHHVEHTPWVGVYYGGMSVAPHTLGGQRPWQAELELLVYVQEASLVSGQDATRRLGRAQSRVLAAVQGDRRLGGTVEMVTALDVTPFQRDLEAERWLFTNEIALRVDVRG